MRTFRVLAALALVAGALAATARPAQAAPSTAYITDPTGDSGPTPDARADITSASINYWHDAITVSVTVAQWTDPATDPGWKDMGTAQAIEWLFDVDGDGTADHAAILQPNGRGGFYGYAGEFSDRTYQGSYFRMQCDVQGVAASPGYRLSLPAGCLGSPSSLRFLASFRYGNWPDASGDLAPDTGWSSAVSPSGEANSGGGLVVDDWGGVHPYDTAAVGPPSISDPPPYWPGQDVVRGTAASFGAGYVLDDWGGIHRYSARTSSSLAALFGPYWPGQDVARGIALMPSGTGGYVLDDWGGLHPFALTDGTKPPLLHDGPYWPGQDVARGVAVLPDGSGGYIVDSWGAFHPFVIPGVGHVAPPKPTDGPYWQGQDVARGVVIDAEGNGGYVLDDWGGIHPFSIPGTAGPVPAPSGGPYWPGQDVARGISVVPAAPSPPPPG